MNPVVSRIIGWHKKTEKQQALVKYRVNSLIASLISLWPGRLWSLLSYFKSDKHLTGQHQYGFTYDELFRPFKYRRLKLLEIGIGGFGVFVGGNSLLAWKAFFPFGSIIGCDINPNSELTHVRTKIYQIDQSSGDQLTALQRDEGPFDIIIDDGSHLSAHQIFTFEHMLDTVKDGGFYIVEDVQTSYWPMELFETQWDGAHVDDPNFSRTCVGYFTDLAKYLNHAEFAKLDNLSPKFLFLAKKIRRITFEHNMIIILKCPNVEPSNSVRRRIVKEP